MSDLRVNTIGDSSGSGPVATLPTSGGSAFTLGPNWGVWEYVGATAITAVTNLDFTDLEAGYDYMFSFRGGDPGNDGVYPELTISHDNGSTFRTTANDYSNHDEGETAVKIRIGGTAIGNDSTGGGFHGDVMILEPGGSAAAKIVLDVSLLQFRNDVNYYSNTSSGGGAYIQASTAIDAVRFSLSAGDWVANGEILVFRRRVS